jgi:hypothetical protein
MHYRLCAITADGSQVFFGDVSGRAHFLRFAGVREKHILHLDNLNGRQPDLEQSRLALKSGTLRE